MSGIPNWDKNIRKRNLRCHRHHCQRHQCKGFWEAQDCWPMGEVSVLYLLHLDSINFLKVFPSLLSLLGFHGTFWLYSSVTMKILFIMKSMTTTIIVALLVYFYSGGFSNGWVWMGNYSWQQRLKLGTTLMIMIMTSLSSTVAQCPFIYKQI